MQPCSKIFPLNRWTTFFLERCHYITNPKKNSDATLSVSHRPIALTSVLGKLFQKILSKQFFWYLESNSLLSPSRYGFHEGRNFSHTHVDLQKQIINVVDANSCLYSIDFDLQDAFAPFLRRHNCQKLYDIGLRGRFPKIRQNFLNNRTLIVRTQDKMS